MKERFDYGQNPDKTEGGELISSYGCDHMTADAEFLLSKAKYKAATGREQRRDADVLCYQIRQSFKPGEITPEEANRIGYETAMRWTKGKYQFFVCTHTDKDHIHIMFEAPPQVQLSKLINNYKTVTSRRIRKEFADFLKPYYQKPYFWSDSYFVCTVSDRSHEMIQRYIAAQGTK